ncbi:MAG: GNAT family N-acetyltransferase [Clostridia bacterium]|nr:GNAT family N-acetyltransferase [Clostridia bacterium]
MSGNGRGAGFQPAAGEALPQEPEDLFLFRRIREEETEQAAEIETICFPPNEACKREHMISRIAAARDFFWVAEDRHKGKIAGFINGIATNEAAFRDEFFTDASIHDPAGKNIMILGLDVLPAYRGKGLARELVRRYRDRFLDRRLVLTCLERLVPMYEKFGFRNLGLSASLWGGEHWHEMDMNTPGILKAAEEYIRQLFAGNADGHGWDHSMRVYRNAMVIAESEPAADRMIVALAALLHDADDYKLFETENNANARSLLAGLGIDPVARDRILAAVNAVSFSKNRGARPDTLEGMIVQDADRLDAIGAIGVARTFAFGGGHGRSLEDSVDHFYEKLLLLKDLMNTRKGKEMAESRHAFLETFLCEWNAEMNGLTGK